MRKTKTYYNEKELPLIMTTFEVSMLLRCSEEYVRRIAHEGRISFQKNGKKHGVQKKRCIELFRREFLTTSDDVF